MFGGFLSDKLKIAQLVSIFLAFLWKPKRHCHICKTAIWSKHGAQDSHLQTVTIPEAAYIQLRRRHPEDEQGNARNM